MNMTPMAKAAASIASAILMAVLLWVGAQTQSTAVQMARVSTQLETLLSQTTDDRAASGIRLSRAERRITENREHIRVLERYSDVRAEPWNPL